MRARITAKFCLHVTLAWAAVTAWVVGPSASYAQPLWGQPVNLGPVVNGPVTDTASDLSPDGLTMFYEHGAGDLWMTTRASIGAPWGTPTKLASPPNTDGFPEATPAISPDLLTLYYFTKQTPNGLADIWFVTRSSVDAPWGNPTALPSPINTDYSEYDPEMSADGLTLFVRSDRPEGFGATDLYVCSRSSLTASWPDPVNLGPNVNSVADEARCSISSDGRTLYFSSNRAGGYGSYDAYYTKYIDGAWTPAVNMGDTINSPTEELGLEISALGTELLFSSDRAGGFGAHDVWVSTIIPEPAAAALLPACLAALGLLRRRRRCRGPARHTGNLSQCLALLAARAAAQLVWLLPP